MCYKCVRACVRPYTVAQHSHCPQVTLCSPIVLPGQRPPVPQTGQQGGLAAGLQRTCSRPALISGVQCKRVLCKFGFLSFCSLHPSLCHGDHPAQGSRTENRAHTASPDSSGPVPAVQGPQASWTKSHWQGCELWLMVTEAVTRSQRLEGGTGTLEPASCCVCTCPEGRGVRTLRNVDSTKWITNGISRKKRSETHILQLTD